MRILLAEYLNYVNGDGKPIGHGKKVLQEAMQVLHGNVTCVVCSNAYLPENVDGSIAVSRIEEICQQKAGKKLNLKILQNIKQSFKQSNAEVLWFTNTEWRLLAYLAFVNRRKKIVVTCYRDIVKDIAESRAKLKGIKLFLVRRGLKRADLVVVTNKHLRISEKQVFVPDYIYNEFYEQYTGMEKKNRIICVGAMRDSKDLRGVVSLFRDTDVEVMIIGGFSDKKEYEWLKNHKADNITIEDRIVPYDEYYRLIAESKFVIIPYKMEAYTMATSGILQEAMFLHTMPIAPRELLNYNSVNGIGYDKLSDIPGNWGQLEELAQNVTFDVFEYEESHVKEKLMKAMRHIVK